MSKAKKSAERNFFIFFLRLFGLYFKLTKILNSSAGGVCELKF